MDGRYVIYRAHFPREIILFLTLLFPSHLSVVSHSHPQGSKIQRHTGGGGGGDLNQIPTKKHDPSLQFGDVSLSFYFRRQINTDSINLSPAVGHIPHPHYFSGLHFSRSSVGRLGDNLNDLIEDDEFIWIIKWKQQEQEHRSVLASFSV